VTESERSQSIAEVSHHEAPSKLAVGAMAVLGALLLGAVVARSHNPDAFNHDVAQLLYFAERMWQGARLYVDLIDENPPLIFWLSMGPVALAQWIGTLPILVFNLSIVLVGFVSASLCYRVMRSAWPASPPAYPLALVGLLLCLELLTPGFDFGQRENLLFIAVMPYLFAAAARVANRPVFLSLALAAGAFAGVGLALKPHFVLLWLAVEGWLMVAARGQWRRPENVAVVGVIAFYILLVFVLARDYFAIIGDSFQLLGAYYESDVLSLLFPEPIVLVAVAGGVLVLVRSSSLDREVRGVLLVAMLAFAATALLQAKGWSYHYYPAKATAILLLGVVGLGLLAHVERLREVLKPSAAALPLLALLLLCVWSVRVLAEAGYNAFGAGRGRPSTTKVLTDVVVERAWHQPIYVMSTSVVPAFPVVNLSGSRWASRFSCLWYLAGSYTRDEKATKPFPYHDREEMGELERFALDAVVEDLESNRPQLLIIDANSYKQAFGQTEFRFLDYFLRDPRFEAIFRNYHHVADVGAYRVFERVFARR
jgi:hypothetical protein